MQEVPKDIDLIIYRFAHRDLMKQLNSEYKRTVTTYRGICCIGCNNVCSSYIIVSFLVEKLAYNYRNTSVRHGNYDEFIHDKRNNLCGKLPKNY